MYIDIKHAVPIAISMLKYVGMPWDLSNLTWIKAFVPVILFLIFPFISIKVHIPFTTHLPPTSVTTSNAVLKRIEELSAPLAVTLVAAAVALPPVLFLYAYPFVLCPCCLCVLSRFANWLHTMLATIPVLHVVLSTTAFVCRWRFGPEPDDQIDEPSEGDTQGTKMRLRDGDHDDDLEAGGILVYKNI